MPGGKEAGFGRKAASLLAGGAMFILIIPWGLYSAAGYLNLPSPRFLPAGAEVALAVALALGALAFVLWGTASFWNLGRGTPAPWTPPVKLVVTGPFKYSRNPLMLGAAVYYFSIGLYFSSAVTGLFMSAGLLLPISVFIKYFEEPYLVKQFGRNYEAYREKTPFLFPRFTSKGR